LLHPSSDEQALTHFPLSAQSSEGNPMERSHMASTRPYEITLVVRPDVDETGFATVVDKVKGWIAAGGGTVTQTDVWGRRRLAYPIKKLTEGQYVLLLADLPAQIPVSLERDLRLSEEILRFLIVRADE
jgi:small subunit ribosomal protein S6